MNLKKKVPCCIVYLPSDFRAVKMNRVCWNLQLNFLYLFGQKVLINPPLEGVYWFSHPTAHQKSTIDFHCSSTCTSFVREFVLGISLVLTCTAWSMLIVFGHF